MTKAEINKELHSRIKRIIIEFSSPIIPMSVLFEMLGYAGITGIFYGILLGAASMVAIELGFEVVKLGTIWVIKKSDTNSQEENSDKEE
jgi:uncharacterized membrane protein